MALLFRNSDRRVEIRSDREGLIRFHDHADGVHYFRRHRGRPGLIATLRRMLAEHHHLQVRRLSDDEVIDEVARRLLNGSLQLLEVYEPRVKGQTTTPPEPPEEQPIEVTAVAPAPVPAEPVAEQTAAPAAEPATFESSVDAAAQAAVLRNAAESGTPFCQECARAAAAKAAEPAPEPATFDSSVDAPAQAAVLKDAAESGTPFCQECARAAAARAS